MHSYLELRQRLDETAKAIDPDGALKAQTVDALLGRRDHVDGSFPVELQQQSAYGETVADTEELLVAASLAQAEFRDFLKRIQKDMPWLAEEDLRGKQSNSCNFDKNTDPSTRIWLAPMKDAQRIIDKASLKYADRYPGPPESWVYDVIRASVVCMNATEIKDVVAWLSTNSHSTPLVAAKNRFQSPTSITKYRDFVFLIKLPVANASFHHVCELQVHHAAMVQYQSQSQHYYKNLRSYFSHVIDVDDWEQRMADLEAIGSYSKYDTMDDGLCTKVSACGNVFRIERLADLLETSLPPCTDAAVRLYQKALVLVISDSNMKSLAVATVYEKLGGALSRRGKYGAALCLLEAAFELRQTDLGDTHPDTLKLQNEVGVCHHRNGKYQMALATFKIALETLELQAGKRHTHTAQAHNDIGCLLRDMGKYTEALDHHQQALQIREAVLGKKHTATASSYDNIGVVMQENGDFEWALQYHRRAFIVRRALLGDHPYTAVSYENIGLLLNRQGKSLRALTLLGRALEIREAFLGDRHPDTARSLNSVGLVLAKLGRTPEALSFYQKALTIREDLLGNDHPDTGVSYSSVGTALRELGHYNEALEYHEKALVVASAANGTHLQTAVFHCNLGTAEAHLGNYDTALKQYHQAKAIRTQVLGQSHPDTLAAQRSVEAILRAKVQAWGRYSTTYSK